MNTKWKAQLHKLRDDDLDMVVWRYLTFPKFIHLISYGALWFCRLQELIDEFEGRMPEEPLKKISESHQGLKKRFNHPSYHKQIDEMPNRNVQDGRSLTAVNCWFIGDEESQIMWDAYVGSPEGVAIRSTIRKIRDNVYLHSDWSFIGKVEYVDYENHAMPTYEANQAHFRAFLKDKHQFVHENELRISTMNIKTPACLSPLGNPFPKDDISGAKMNNFDEAGLYIRVNLNNLFDTIILHPESQIWFKNLIVHLSQKGESAWNVEESKLRKTSPIGSPRLTVSD
jgi:hypothetical protein